MIWPLPHLIEVVRVVRADRLFEPLPDAAEVPADALAERALAVAISQLGRGEEGGNNVGPDVARYVAPAKPPANWCAGFVGWCYQEAALELLAVLPFKRSLGAKRLGKNVGAVGRVFTDPALARPGDLFVLDRGPRGSWMGHVGFVAEKPIGYSFAAIEGNSGPRVKRSLRGVDADRFAFFASLRRG